MLPSHVTCTQVAWKTVPVSSWLLCVTLQGLQGPEGRQWVQPLMLSYWKCLSDTSEGVGALLSGQCSNSLGSWYGEQGAEGEGRHWYLHLTYMAGQVFLVLGMRQGQGAGWQVIAGGFHLIPGLLVYVLEGSKILWIQVLELWLVPTSCFPVSQMCFAYPRAFFKSEV